MSEEKLTDASGHSLTVLNYKGYRLPTFPLEAVQGLETFHFRDDDILISGFPKSGTHWVWEMIRMLQAGKTELPLVEKGDYMIEFNPDIPTMTSPRILSTHVLLDQIPTLQRSKCKVVYLTRNPRDVAVSFYNHHTKLSQYYHYKGAWTDYFHLFLEGRVDYGSWFDYTRHWESVFASNPEMKVITLSYEDMKEDVIREATKLSAFLGYVHSEDFIQSVCDKCDFAKMKKLKGKLDVSPEGEVVMYRKGEVGDWHNWFTDDQVRQMDEVYASKMAGSTFTPRYTLT